MNRFLSVLTVILKKKKMLCCSCGDCSASSSSLQDLQEFVDGSGDDGFIVFTLGSMVSTMPAEKAKQFFDAFRQIPQRVNMSRFIRRTFLS